MGDSASTQSRALLARLDRIPVWPYPKQILVLLGAGFFFAFFDVVTIGFALPVLIREFGVSGEEASWTITSGLVGYIVGSLLDSRIGDRYGRRVSLYLSVGAFSLGSLLAATSPSLGWLVFWRFIAGMGIGAEIAIVTTYTAEVSPGPLRGRYTGWTVAAGFGGFAAVPMVAALIVPEFSWGWRALFVIGAAGGVLIGFMRQMLPPSAHWLVSQGRLAEAESTVEAAEAWAEEKLGRELPAPSATGEAEPSAQSGLGLLLRGVALRRLVLLAIVWFVYYIGNYGWLTLAPDLFSTHGFTLSQSMGALALTGLGFVGGSISAVYLADQIDRRRTSAIIALLWALTLVGIGLYPSTATITGLGFIASFTIGFIIPLLYTVTGESFPTGVRATGIALSDGFGHLGGAFCGQIILGVAAIWGFQGAFLAMAATGLITAVLVSFTEKRTGAPLDLAED